MERDLRIWKKMIIKKNKRMSKAAHFSNAKRIAARNVINAASENLKIAPLIWQQLLPTEIYEHIAHILTDTHDFGVSLFFFFLFDANSKYTTSFWETNIYKFFNPIHFWKYGQKKRRFVIEKKKEEKKIHYKTLPFLPFIAFYILYSALWNN